MYKMLHTFSRKECNVLKYPLNVASTRKPFAREGSRSRRCHKIRDAIGVARVRFAISTRKEDDVHPPCFTPCIAYSVSSPAASVRAIEGGHVWPAEISQFFHTSFIFSFSCYFQTSEEHLYQVLRILHVLDSSGYQF